MIGYEEIEDFKHWLHIEKINKGYSSDQKYKITRDNGETLLLRLSDRKNYEEKKKEYDRISKIETIGFPMSKTKEFGICGEGALVYSILTWVEGEDLSDVLPKLSMEQQYQLGKEAGEILKSIHSLEHFPHEKEKKASVENKLRKLADYEKSDLRMPGDQALVDYIKKNIENTWPKGATYIHGDFHPYNLIYTKEGRIGVIDFNRSKIGDPYEEFYKLQVFGVELSIPYVRGELDGYFNGKIPEIFWETNFVYILHASLYSIVWALPFGAKQVEGMRLRYKRAFQDYKGFSEKIPRWYQNKEE